MRLRRPDELLQAQAAKSPMPRVRYLTERQTAEACGVSERSARNWTARTTLDRLRKTKRGGRYWYRADRLIGWLTARGWHDKAASVEAWCVANGDAAVPPGPRRRTPRSKTVRRPGEMDIFATRDVIGTMLVDALAAYDGATALEIAARSKAVRETADLLADMELKCLTVDERLKRVIETATATKIVGRVMAEARTNLQTLPAAVALELSVMTDANAIVALLENRLKAMLRCLEESYLAAEIGRYLSEGDK